MYLITLMILAVLNLKGVEPGSVLGCFGNFCEKDATTEANYLFRKMKTPEDSYYAFDAAGRALDELEHKNPNGKEDVKTILRGYLDLKYLPRSFEGETMDCKNATLIEEFYKLHELMASHTTKYESSLSDFPLSSNLIYMRNFYFDRCGEVFKNEVQKTTSNEDAFILMQQFSVFYEGKRSTTGYIKYFLSGNYLNAVKVKERWTNFYAQLELDSRKWREWKWGIITSEEIVTKKLFEKSCGSIEKDKSIAKQFDTLLKVMKMIDRYRLPLSPYEPLIVDYQICLEARKVFLSKELNIHKNEVLAKTSGNQD